MSIKKTLMGIEEAVLNELLEVTQEALNDDRTAKRVAKQLGKPLARVHALAAIAVQLSTEPGLAPDVSTEEQLDLFEAELGEAMTDG